MKFLKLRRGSKASSVSQPSLLLDPDPDHDQDNPLYPRASLLGLPAEIRTQIWHHLLPQETLIACPCIAAEAAEPSWWMGNAGQCSPCLERAHRYRSFRLRSASGGPKVPPLNFDGGLLRVNGQMRDELLALLARSGAADTYTTCMQSCMGLLLASLPVQKRASIRAVRFRHLRPANASAAARLQKPPRLEVFHGLKLPLDTRILNLETRERATGLTTHRGAVSVCTDVVFHWTVPAAAALEALEAEISRGKEDERRRQKRERMIEERNKPGRPNMVGALRRLGTLGAYGSA